MSFLRTLDQVDELIYQESWPDAESLIRRAIASFGPHDVLQVRLIKILMAHDQNAEAWKILNSLDHSDQNLTVLRCQIALRQKKKIEGHKLLKEILKNLHLYDQSEIEELARDLYIDHYFEESARIFKWLLENNKYTKEIFYQINVNLALCSWIIENEDTAVYAAEALKLKPQDPLALSLLGNTLFDQGKKKEGLKILEQVGVDELLHLQCEEGAKRLVRWHRKTNDNSEYMRYLSSTLSYWERSRQWDAHQLTWVKDSCDNIHHSSFLIDCPETDRLVGFSVNPQISDRPLVNLSLCARERQCALEEKSFLQIPSYTDKHLVDRWHDSVGEKVLIEPYILFWEIVESIS